MSSLKLENIERIKKLKRESDRLRTVFDRYLEAIKSPSCDKHEFSFNANDDRFCMFSVNVKLTGYTGHYGNSSCYTFENFDNAVIQSALSAYLDANKCNVLQWMSRHLDAESAKLRDAATKELEELHALLRDNTELDHDTE